MKYIPQLDGLRAIAITLVVLSHFLPQTPVVGLANLGGFGVRLFFVLSGYLITSVLLNLKEENLPIGNAAATFYWKRFLRLSPPYYLALGFCYLLGMASMREDFWWHALYLSNFLIAFEGDWGQVGHLWSLSVEEQFYLIWFAVVMFLGLSGLRNAIIGGIFLSIAYRVATIFLGYDYFSRILLPGVSDFLLVGSLLAYIQAKNPLTFKRISGAFVNPIAFTVLALATILINLSNPSSIKSLLQPSIWLMADISILLFAALPQYNRLSSWLTWPILVHVGKISYGIYVYHMLVPITIDTVSPKIALYLSNSHWMIPLIIYSMLAFLIAELSWVLLEKPLRRYRSALDEIGLGARRTRSSDR